MIRVYDGAFEWRVPEGGSFDDLPDEDPVIVPAATEHQGEAIAYDPETGGYLHASEDQSGNPIPIYRVPCVAD
ncbi:MAG: hypothetical protein M5R36_17450 [Deltaproteobacteria bacterium]|nr:hypothetical protein [Deltaproteobacteria bacterium]